VYSALEARIKVSLSSSAGKHLSLDDELVCAYRSVEVMMCLTKVLGYLLSLGRRESRDGFGCGDAILDN
jgi:hypothetical protein